MLFDNIQTHPLISNHRPFKRDKVAHLEKDILRNGLLEPLIVWERTNGEYYMVGGGVPMNMLKSGRLAVVFFVVSYLGVSLLGCATTSQIQALEERTQQALEKAEQAVKEARSAKAAVEDSAEYSYEAAASARRADNAASRAEDAASRTEKAAESAAWSADRAEKIAKKCEDIFRRIMSK